jgi:hypothetical protein
MALAHYRLNMRGDHTAHETIGFDSIPPDSVINAAIESWALSVTDGAASRDVRWSLHDGQGILRYGWRDADGAFSSLPDSPRLKGGDR